MLKCYKLNKIINRSLKSSIRKCSTCSPTWYTERGSVYVHWPYCKQLCSYCNFVKYVPKENSSWTLPNTVIEDAMVCEIESVLQESPIKTITSVFFGGGTPSLARPQMVEKVMNALGKKCVIAPCAEVTIEANPSLKEPKMFDFRLSGVNRLSLGVQSLQEDILILINRDHSVEEALACIESAKKIFPSKLSIDLMFALPRHHSHLYKDDLKRVLEVCDDHLSLYQLTVEKGTPLHRQIEKGILKLHSKEEEADMYDLSQSVLAGAGFRRYEVSNFARVPSAQSTHNKSVWQGGQYIGIGPGAHSRVVKKRSSYVEGGESSCLADESREARINSPDPQIWLWEVAKKGNGSRRIVPQTCLDMQMEYLATSLRTSEGATLNNWSVFCPTPLAQVFPQSLLDPNLLMFENGVLKATEKGINVLDFVLPSLINWLGQDKP